MRRKLIVVTILLLVASAFSAPALLHPQAALAANPTWYLAEGSTAWGFGAQISIQNPNSSALDATVTYLGDAGVIGTATYSLFATSQTTINVKDAIGEKDFSAKVECSDPTKTIAVDRTMYWMGGPGGEAEQVMEIHNSVGVTAPSSTWFLPEGSSAWGFETWLLIQNPNPVDTTCHVTYMIEGAGQAFFDRVVPANSRRTYSMADDIGSHDSSIRVESPPGQPVIAERAVYRDSRRSGSESIGTTQAAPEYFLAEGTTAWGFTTYLLVQNPNAAAANVAVWFLTPTGPVAYPGFSMPAMSRKTIRVNDFLHNTDCSIYVQGLGGANIIAERSMYWGGETVFGEAAHDSIGVAATHKTWYLPDGSCMPDSIETWTMVQNPNANAVNIQVTYMSSTGIPTSFADTLQPYTRKTYNMASTVPTGRYSTRVSSMSPGTNIIVERSIYYFTQALGGTYRTSGSNTIGAWED